MRPSLLETVRGLLERTFRIDSGLAEVAPFVIGDLGYAELYRARSVERDVRSAFGSAKTLVRETTDGTAVCVYFPDTLIRCLEVHPPQRGLGEENLDAFATFVEEIDHLLVLAERSLQRRPVSLFELELHAGVSKYLVLARFLAGARSDIEEVERIWLRHRLFERFRFCDEDPAVRERYRDSARWARRLLDGLSTQRSGERVDTLREFHSHALPEKLRQISRLA